MFLQETVSQIHTFYNYIMYNVFIVLTITQLFDSSPLSIGYQLFTHIFDILLESCLTVLHTNVKKILQRFHVDHIKCISITITHFFL